MLPNYVPATLEKVNAPKCIDEAKDQVSRLTFQSLCLESVILSLFYGLGVGLRFAT